jgi:CDP-paratose 2-epimerase
MRNQSRYSTVLITGGAGFIGSNLAVKLKNKYPFIKVIALDNLTRRGSEMNISRLRDAGVEFVHGDIRCQEDLQKINDFQIMIECSAEPSVLSGYSGSPYYLLNTNLMGAINCFELCRNKSADIIFLSTSRVYPYEAINSFKCSESKTRFLWDDVCVNSIDGWTPKFGFSENFQLNGPRSMYGATKLSGELLLQEYAQMYGLRIAINRCGVIAGPWQFGKVDQGVFTMWMLNHYFKKPLKYIGYGGYGKQVRDLLHIDDLFSAIDIQISGIEKFNNGIFNIGGGDVNLSLIETTDLCQKITGNQVFVGSDMNTRPADLKIYKTDSRKFKDLTGWNPEKTSEQILGDTYSWIDKNYEMLVGLI